MTTFNSALSAVHNRGAYGIQKFDITLLIPFVDDDTITHFITMPNEAMTLSKVSMRHVGDAASGHSAGTYLISITNNSNSGVAMLAANFDAEDFSSGNDTDPNLHTTASNLNTAAGAVLSVSSAVSSSWAASQDPEVLMVSLSFSLQ